MVVRAWKKGGMRYIAFTKKEGKMRGEGCVSSKMKVIYTKLN